MTRFVWAAVFVGWGGVVAAYPPPPKERAETPPPATQADWDRSATNLKQIGLAVHNYESTYGHFPHDVRDAAGKPILSWRVQLLPYIEEGELYKQFNLQDAWDGPTNKPLLARMPKVFAPEGETKDEPFTTRYQVFVGGGAMFTSPRGVRISDITDGTSNTLMIVEAAEPVPWSKPADLTYDPMGPLPNLGGVFKGGFNAALADGSVHFIPSDTSPDRLRAWITHQGGEIVDPPGAEQRPRKGKPYLYEKKSVVPAKPQVKQ